jgi:metal-responsive CopG/Arc/MetJ family transcriptional regulator
MAKQTKMGRPTVGDSAMEQIAIRMPPEMLQEVDAIVQERYGQGGRTMVIRELVAWALETRNKRKAKS